MLIFYKTERKFKMILRQKRSEFKKHRGEVPSKDGEKFATGILI